MIWGKYRIRVEEPPLRVTVTDAAQQIRQQIQFDLDSTAVRFRLGGRPVFGLGEGLTGLGIAGEQKTEMRNGQGSSDLRIAGSRVPIPWVVSPEGWGVFVGQPMGTFDLTGETGVVRSPVATSTRNVYVILGETPCGAASRLCGANRFSALTASVVAGLYAIASHLGKPR